MCILDGCENKHVKRYGGYCRKHRNSYLIHDGLIMYNTFTFREGDYLKINIRETLKYLKIKNVGKKSKKDLFNILTEMFISEEDELRNRVKYLIRESIQLICKIQGISRGKNVDRLRGYGYIEPMKCNNTMDFYTYDTIDEIDKKYFFSYRDNNSLIWFFDIRSFNKLIELKQGNPFTRDKFPLSVIESARKLTKHLDLENDDSESIDNETVRLTREQALKQKTIDIFSQMDQFGYGCNIEWFLNLNIRKLKKLYRNLEDIWNYRLNLTHNIKSRISPPNGLVFNIPIHQVNVLTDRISVQDIILTEVMKFNNAITNEDKKLGYMYFLLGLGLVSRECYECHQWIIHAVY